MSGADHKMSYGRGPDRASAATRSSGWLRRDDLRHGDGRSYLRRWIAELPGGWSVRVHRWDSSDGAHPHDHPWPFFSVALWGSAFEELWWRGSDGAWRARLRTVRPLAPRWYRAASVHRVLAPSALTTLVVTGPRSREWGFWLPSVVSGREAFRRGVRPQFRWVPHSEHRR